MSISKWSKIDCIRKWLFLAINRIKQWYRLVFLMDAKNIWWKIIEQEINFLINSTKNSTGPHPSETSRNSFLKTQWFKAYGNDHKGTQQINNYSRKYTKNVVIKVRVCGIWRKTVTFFPHPMSLRWKLHSRLVQTRTQGFLFLKIPVRGLSPRRGMSSIFLILLPTTYCWG